MPPKYETLKAQIDNLNEYTNIEVFRFYKNNKEQLHAEETIDEIISYCMFNSHRRSLIILLCEDNIDYDIHKNDDNLFCCACTYGCLELAKYLYEIRGNVNIHADDEHAFAESIIGTHYTISDWLLSLNEIIDFDVAQEYIYDVYFDENDYYEYDQYINKFYDYLETNCSNTVHSMTPIRASI